MPPGLYKFILWPFRPRTCFILICHTCIKINALTFLRKNHLCCLGIQWDNLQTKHISHQLSFWLHYMIKLILLNMVYNLNSYRSPIVIADTILYTASVTMSSMLIGRHFSADSSLWRNWTSSSIVASNVDFSPRKPSAVWWYIWPRTFNRSLVSHDRPGFTMKHFK